MLHKKADPAGLARALRVMRNQRNLSICAVVERMLTQYGVKRTRQSVYQHEAGARIPTADTVEAYCRVYNLNTEDARRLYELAGYVVIFSGEDA